MGIKELIQTDPKLKNSVTVLTLHSQATFQIDSLIVKEQEIVIKHGILFLLPPVCTNFCCDSRSTCL